MTNQILNKISQYDLDHVDFIENDNNFVFECFSADDYYFVKLMIKETGIKARTILY